MSHSLSLSSPKKSGEFLLTRIERPPWPRRYVRRVSISACSGHHPLGFEGGDLVSPDVLQGPALEPCFSYPQNCNDVGPLALHWQSVSCANQHISDLSRSYGPFSGAVVVFCHDRTTGHVDNALENGVGRWLHGLGQSKSLETDGLNGPLDPHSGRSKIVCRSLLQLSRRIDSRSLSRGTVGRGAWSD